MPELFDRTLQFPREKSFFLFGARNTGKSTLIKSRFTRDSTLQIDLLIKETESRFLHNPDELYDIVMALPSTTTHVFIDEIQKVPALLDVVHRLMGDCDKYFILSGSSARKLKYGGANLLAGRAFVYHMFPLTHEELGEAFDLNRCLHWGSLPECIRCEDDLNRSEFLYAYAHTYLKEEIWMEQFVKEIDPFHRFLEVAAQCNGKVINYTKIARDVGLADKTVRQYYAILEDTLLGFTLPAYHGSFRKRLGKQPKFYLFDTGVTRALAHLTESKLEKRSNAYGNAFEHFIILECMRMADYHRLRYRFSYLRTYDDQEIDLIVERPGQATLFIEIKSTSRIEEIDIKPFLRLTQSLEKAECICICDDLFAKQIQHVTAIPWRDALQRYFTAS